MSEKQGSLGEIFAQQLVDRILAFVLDLECMYMLRHKCENQEGGRKISRRRTQQLRL
jgi:hypothetical protein